MRMALQTSLVGDPDRSVIKEHLVVGAQPPVLGLGCAAEFLVELRLEGVVELVAEEMVLILPPRLGEDDRFDVACRLGRFDLDQVMLGETRRDQHAAGEHGLIVGEVLGLIGVKPEAKPDEHEDADAEEESAFSFEAGFAQQTFESAIRHTWSYFGEPSRVSGRVETPGYRVSQPGSLRSSARRGHFTTVSPGTADKSASIAPPARCARSALGSACTAPRFGHRRETRPAFVPSAPTRRHNRECWSRAAR